MNKFDVEKVLSILEYFHGEITILISLISQFENADYGEKARLQQQLKQKYKEFKDKLKRQIKMLIDHDANRVIVDHLLPPLCVAHTHLQELGVNRINPNSIHKVSQNIIRVNEFIEHYYENIKSTTSSI